jgi:hypothetical protein
MGLNEQENNFSIAHGEQFKKNVFQVLGMFDRVLVGVASDGELNWRFFLGLQCDDKFKSIGI